MDFIKFIEYSRKCNWGDCTCYKKFKFYIEVFDAITGECILENRKGLPINVFDAKQLIPSIVTRFATRE